MWIGKKAVQSIVAVAILFALVPVAVIGYGSNATSQASANPSSKIFVANGATVSQQDVALAFAFSTLQPGTPTGADLITRANLLLPGSGLDIPTSTVLNPPNPTLANFKALGDGGTQLTQQDLAIFFAAFTLLQGQADPGSVVLTPQALCDRANLLLPGTSLDIPTAQCSLIVDPRSLAPAPNVTLKAAIPANTPVSTTAIAVLDTGLATTGFQVPVEDPTNAGITAISFSAFGNENRFATGVRFQVSGMTAANLTAFVAPIQEGLTSLSISGVTNQCVLIYTPSNLFPTDSGVTVLAESTNCP